MMKIAVVTGSTRPGRKSAAVAAWVLQHANQRGDASFELLDIADFDLPLLDEPVPPSMQQYTQPHTRAWSEAVASYDGYVFVTPEYNHSLPAALKNALDFLLHEWADKAAGIVSYGAVGGVRAAEHLRGVLGELSVADVRAQVALSLRSDFENYTTFTPAAGQVQSLNGMLDQVVAWAGALQALRVQRAESAA
jgi:NAD(P)H-dependent FMN reductase